VRQLMAPCSNILSIRSICLSFYLSIRASRTAARRRTCANSWPPTPTSCPSGWSKTRSQVG